MPIDVSPPIVGGLKRSYDRRCEQKVCAEGANGRLVAEARLLPQPLAQPRVEREGPVEEEPVPTEQRVRADEVHVLVEVHEAAQAREAHVLVREVHAHVGVRHAAQRVREGEVLGAARDLRGVLDGLVLDGHLRDRRDACAACDASLACALAWARA